MGNEPTPKHIWRLFTGNIDEIVKLTNVNLEEKRGTTQPQNRHPIERSTRMR